MSFTVWGWLFYLADLNQPSALAIENYHHSHDSFCAPLATCLGCISFQPLGVLTCLFISISLLPKPTQYAPFCPLRCPLGCSLSSAFPSHSVLGNDDNHTSCSGDENWFQVISFLFLVWKVFWLCLEQVTCLRHGTTHEIVSVNFLLDYKFLDTVTMTHPSFHI